MTVADPGRYGICLLYHEQISVEQIHRRVTVNVRPTPFTYHTLWYPVIRHDKRQIPRNRWRWPLTRVSVHAFLARLQASTALQLRSSLCWNVTQCRFVHGYRRSGTTWRCLNVDYQLPTYDAQHPRRAKTSLILCPSFKTSKNKLSLTHLVQIAIKRNPFGSFGGSLFQRTDILIIRLFYALRTRKA